ncbi:MAG: glycosyltransferase [Thermodesulfobacteriota bacterium]
MINGVKTIEDCIKSILNQSYKDIKYVVIDGNSTDERPDVINR